MARLDPKHFTRRRTLTLPTIVSVLLSSVHAAVQWELDQFFANLRNRADSVREVTAQAFYQARYKISALVFGEVNQRLSRGFKVVREFLPSGRHEQVVVLRAPNARDAKTMTARPRRPRFAWCE
ncbi:hypothetical protein [Accumulibacter sp.]|uniref:hypothetical protein n=1 Tax=Accumulibacter sp. TaxID=2053492 RepID=UPI00262754F1|nr:hypothetical protein [Accumulibacter sp.]